MPRLNGKQVKTIKPEIASDEKFSFKPPTIFGHYRLVHIMICLHMLLGLMHYLRGVKTPKFKWISNHNGPTNNVISLICLALAIEYEERGWTMSCFSMRESDNFVPKRKRIEIKSFNGYKAVNVMIQVFFPGPASNWEISQNFELKGFGYHPFLFLKPLLASFNWLQYTLGNIDRPQCVANSEEEWEHKDKRS